MRLSEALRAGVISTDSRMAKADLDEYIPRWNRYIKHPVSGTKWELLRVGWIVADLEKRGWSIEQIADWLKGEGL